MLYHCGLLDERPEKSPTLEWIKRPRMWGRLPPEIERELRIFLAMPGFTSAYLQRVFYKSYGYIARNGSRYEDWRHEVAENWLSATREDCMKLCRLRGGQGNVPVISQLRAIQDLKSGISLLRVSEEYEVSVMTLADWRDHGVRFNGKLPSGFSLLRGSTPFHSFRID